MWLPIFTVIFNRFETAPRFEADCVSKFLFVFSLRIDLVNAVWCPGVRLNVLRFSEYHVQAGGGNDVDVTTRLMTHIRNESFECGFPERDKVAFHGSAARKLKKEIEVGFENSLCFVCRVPRFVHCLLDLC
jgi:hypothetical protein